MSTTPHYHRNNNKSSSHHKEKLAVTFDVDARREYLLGFSKRKRERRKEALQKLERQAKEEKKEARTQYRNTLMHERAEQQKKLDSLQDEHNDDGEADERLAERNVRGLVGNEAVTRTTTTYEDDFTHTMFGDATVMVTTTSTDLSHVSPTTQFAPPPVTIVPKNTKFKVTKNEKIATRLRDKLKGKKTKKRNPAAHHRDGHRGKKRR